MGQTIETSVKCHTAGCAEHAVASVENKSLCRQHFISNAYQNLESIAAQIQEPRFHEIQGEAVGRFLEECMRCAADIACGTAPPSNLERAQVLDVLLWASELHGRLRRGPRIRAKIAVQLRSEAHHWEEDTETHLLSRHGFQLACEHEVQIEDRVVCVRKDNGWLAEARVVWVRRTESGKSEAGFEFLGDENFWGVASWPSQLAEPKR